MRVFALALLAALSMSCEKPVPPKVVVRHSSSSSSSVVFAQNDCGNCSAACKQNIDLCRSVRTEAGAQCALANACLCQCRLNAGGCGLSHDYLARCVSQSAAEAAAELLAAPSPCGPNQRACMMLSGIPLCVPASDACPR